MEQNEEITSMSSTMDVSGAVVVADKEDVQRPTVPTSPTSTIEGGAAAANEQVARTVFPSEEQFRSVFSNAVITDTILSYLSFDDMKACRQVSRQFLEMIETHKRFKQSQVILFRNQESPFFKDFNFVLMDPDRICWPGVRIDVFNLRGQLWKIPRAILHNVQLVSLICSEKICSTLVGTDIYHVLTSTPKISHLQLDIELLVSGLHDVFGCTPVQDNLKDLRRLDIVGRNNRCNGNNIYRLSYPVTCTYHILKSCEQLASILQCRLESLRIPKLRFYGEEEERREIQSIQATIMKLLQQNHETVREISLHLDFWKQDDDIGALKLPRLKILTVTIDKAEQETLEHFLVHHESLEEIEIAVRSAFGKNLFDVIQQRFCPNLKTLHLKAKNFVDSVRGRVQTVDWTFLGTMTQLRDFQLSRPYCNNNANWEAYGNGRRLLESLPRDQLERLGLRGIGTGAAGFWRSDEVETEPSLSIRLDLLGGFRNLRRLSFYRCRDAVDDDVMRFIVTEMTSLEELEVSHCSKLSDAGIRGTLDDGSDSIRNLQGLKELSIRACPLVTPDGILSCVHFPLLRRFDCVSHVRVSKSFVFTLLSQNPNLTALAANLVDRSRKMQKRVNNPRITLIHLDDAVYDSDSDADFSDIELSDSGENDAE